MHFSISCIVMLIVAYFAFFVWYPAPLAQALDIFRLFTLLVIVDSILGPLLGWVVYKEGKKSLKFDLLVIVLIQLSAFTYGVYSLMQARPLWIVYSTVHFDLVQKTQIEQRDLKKAELKYQKIPLGQPQVVALKLDVENHPINSTNYLKVGWTSYPVNYTEIENVQDRLKKFAFDLKYLGEANKQSEVDAILKRYPHANAWLPLKAKVKDMVVLLNTNKGEVVKIVDLRPLQ